MSISKSVLLSTAVALAMLGTAPVGWANGVTVINLPPYIAQPPSGRMMKNPLPAPATDTVKAETAGDARVAGTSGTTSNAPSLRAYGTFGIPYTSVRVQSSGWAAGATTASLLSTTFPYRAIGKLTFTAGGYSYMCSASLIMRSVMVTAAHCTGDFGSGAIFSNWVFRPGYWGAPGATSAQIAPFGSWTVQAVAVAPTWLNGKDTGRGAARNNDLAVFIVKKNASGQFIGDKLGGWLKYGWNNYSFTQSAKTGNLWTAAVSTLGYPGIIDDGDIMQRTDGPTYKTTVGGAKQLWQGSNLTAGSSGGPWIVNFGFKTPELYDGAAPGLQSAPNRVIGVTSWGSEDPNTPKDNYSSQFAQNAEYPNSAYGTYGAGNIGALLYKLCNTKPKGSTSTYAQLGYCNR